MVFRRFLFKFRLNGPVGRGFVLPISAWSSFESGDYVLWSDRFPSFGVPSPPLVKALAWSPLFSAFVSPPLRFGLSVWIEGFRSARNIINFRAACEAACNAPFYGCR